MNNLAKIRASLTNHGHSLTFVGSTSGPTVAGLRPDRAVMRSQSGLPVASTTGWSLRHRRPYTVPSGQSVMAGMIASATSCWASSRRFSASEVMTTTRSRSGMTWMNWPPKPWATKLGWPWSLVTHHW